jgi:hypothetical protein
MVDLFAFGGTGYLGKISPGEIDFKFVLRQPPPVALAAFESLYVNGNPQGKSYALSGIRELNPTRFKELLVGTQKTTESVVVGRGCFLYPNEKLRDVAVEIGRGKFDFQSPEQR